MTQRSAPHRIRLAGPWECQPRDGLPWLTPAEPAESAACRRIKLPLAWQELFGEQSGTAIFTRQFNSPTGLSQQKLWIAGSYVRGTGTIRLNGELLGKITPDLTSFQLPILSPLQSINRLEIQLHCQPHPDWPCGLWEPIFLEIEE